MTKSVKIKTLVAPAGDLGEFDPGRYLGGLEFYETDDAITEEERDDLAQFVHYLAFIALSNRSTNWPSSIVPLKSSAHRALASHFCDLAGWQDIVTSEGIPYRGLASLLMKPYPPRRRPTS